MHHSRPHRAVPFALLAALVVLLAATAPVLGAPAGASGSGVAPADHVACDVTFDAEGNLLLDGTALTENQAAVLGAALANTDAGATLELAADPDAETCLNLVIDTAGDPVSA